MSRGAPSRLEAAALFLKDGPQHTLDVARQVLSLSGHPGAASAAVFALLGSDPRFTVDGEGRWRLTGTAPVGPPLDSVSYAVVDVETTGGSVGKGHRITEVAVVEIRDGMITESWETLVNPGRTIPPFVARLTGITDEMVVDAPYFEAVADDLMSRLEGRVFVAHNAPFDWGFVNTQLTDALGLVPDLDRLCTVRLARRLLPTLPRRNLDALTQHFDVLIEGRHRAHGDAYATAQVFLRLLDVAREQGIHDLAGLTYLVDRKGHRPYRGRKGKRSAGPDPDPDTAGPERPDSS